MHASEVGKKKRAQSTFWRRGIHQKGRGGKKKPGRCAFASHERKGKKEGEILVGQVRFGGRWGKETVTFDLMYKAFGKK